MPDSRFLPHIKSLVAALVLAASLLAGAQDPLMAHPAVQDRLQPPAPGEIRLEGYLGKKIDLCIRNRIMPQDVEHLIEPFRHREETRWWQSEFWGKWFTSLALAYRYNQDPALLSVMDSATRGLIETQTPDGYIGNYRPEAHLKQWDIWGRKYCLLGLIARYDADPDTAALEAAKRLVGHLMGEVGPGKENIVLTGNYRGMASSSVLEPVIGLYRLTGDSRCLEFAKYIVRQWETGEGPQLVSKALAGVPVARRFPIPKSWWSWENGAKAYEMMSCYEGLCELYRATGEADYLQAVLDTWGNIRETEINLAGSGSSQECWYGGRKLQTVPVLHAMETCVTATWIKFCAQALRLTGEPRYAEAIEQAVYNALLGAMTPDGKDFAKYSPLQGRRSLGDNQCGMSLHCCNANGPRGLLIAPQVAVMASSEGPVVNIYETSTTTITLPSGNRVEITQETDYPRSGTVTVRVSPRLPERFTLRLRIPEWSRRTVISAPGADISDAVPGSYARVASRWKTQDSVTLKLDLRGKVIRDPGGSAEVAIMRGPILLARDSRLGVGDVDGELQRLVADEEGFIELEPDTSFQEPFWMVFKVPVVDDPSGRDSGEKRMIRMCDFSSAGNTWESEVRYRVWLPVLLDLSVPKPGH
ncbi:MAG: glycoside hydrolase family 127 protein [Candidatus Glassbacteria bacterium]|nr:glycoside hydrolase family 127 protein [Candidatus Glassbacteria bacterium]